MRISTSRNTQRAVAADPAQARAALGGLQDHSIGPLYPWAVVGRGNDKWEVHNLQASTVVHCKGSAWQGSCAEALAVAHMAKQGYTEGPAPLSAHERARLAHSSAVVLGALNRPYAGRAGSYALRADEAERNLGLLPLDVQVD